MEKNKFIVEIYEDDGQEVSCEDALWEALREHFPNGFSLKAVEQD